MKRRPPRSTRTDTLCPYPALFLAPEGMRQTEAFFRRAGITIEPVTLDHGELARQAFLDFGKGRHKAGLNFGDCFSYALAKATDEPLLFKGNDFALTDIEAAA